MRPISLAGCLSFLAVAAVAQSATPARQPAGDGPALPLKRAATPTTAAITATDLMSRLYPYADDSMMGREAGSEANLRATQFIANEVQRLGLKPAGDSGTYFQSVPLIARAFDQKTALTLGTNALKAGVDYVARDQGPSTRSIDGVPVIFAGAWGDPQMLPPEQGVGKLVIVGAPRVAQQNAPSWFVPRAQVNVRYRGAAGIALVTFDQMPEQVRQSFAEPLILMKTESPPNTQPLPTYIYLTNATARAILGVASDSAAVGRAGQSLRGTVIFSETARPARNVVAILPGTDSTVAGEYVALGAHNDHVGYNHSPVDHDSLRAFNTQLRAMAIATPQQPMTPERMAQIRVNVDSLHRLRPARADSIYNGADDDGSGSMSLLEIAEAFAKERAGKPRRSLVFVWHTAEELGLYGSQYFTDHPTVPRDSIVAQLNMDMIGRGAKGEEALGGPTYLQLIGSRRLSTELGEMVEQVNHRQTLPFSIDYQYDAAGHPEQYYCRSDHYMYARYGIPIVFFSTGDHQDYHQVTDEPQYIDYEHMRRVAQLIHDVAVSVANLDHRVVVDKPKPDPHGQCQQ